MSQFIFIMKTLGLPPKFPKRDQLFISFFILEKEKDGRKKQAQRQAAAG